MCLGEGSGHLHEDMDDARRLDWTDGSNQPVEIQAVEVFHDVIEDAVRRAAVVEIPARIGMPKPTGELHFALEARLVLLARALLQEQLDRRRPAEHRVRGAMDDSHSALAELLLEGV